jgi:lysophospholipase L1-like esterase
MIQRTTILAISIAVAAALFAPAAEAAMDERCFVPSFLTEPGYNLGRVAASVKNDNKLSVLLVSGSPSQVGGTKGLRSYPAYLENALRQQLPGINVSVQVRAKARQTAAETLRELPAMIEDTKPALVIWQVGTVDTFRQTAPDAFADNLTEGLAAIAKLDADAVLLDMQYSPRTDQLVDYETYLDALRTASEQAKVLLFDRYEIMRYWNVAGSFDLSSLRNDGLYESIHVCLGELLADFILRGSGLKESKGLGG